MIQFTDQQMAQIKARTQKAMLEQLIQENQVILNSDTLVPPDGRATWNLYYFCPEHGVRLTWQRDKPTSHCCPIDNKEFTGEPYDGAWWRWLNGLNAKACYQLGLLWQLTGEQRYLNKVTEILLLSAQYYPDYQVHGGIPYNGPGKANAQTLCEANCHLDLARGYDFIKQQLNQEQQVYIEQRLLRQGAEFLMQHRASQLHNHEMKINATIGVIGLILDDNRYLDFALNSEYGLHYQLTHGCSAEGMWFEGSIHYHYYALQAVLNFEKLAYSTPYSLSSNANLLKMLKFPLNLVLNTGDFPRLNDCIAGQEKLTHSHLFEFAYQHYPCEEFAQALATIYRDAKRDNMDALLYGVDELPQTSTLNCRSIHASDAGITIDYDAEHNNAMLFKHSPYGGEHDHYDRLGLILVKNGQEILPDLGTTGYGAPLHYGYYKNSATHNTLVVNQQNQSPINPTLLNYAKNELATIIDCQVDWRQPPATVDSHTLEHWDNESYQDIQFRRTMIRLDQAYIELNHISNPHQQQLDLTYHVRGWHKLATGWQPIRNPFTGVLAEMKQIYVSAKQQQHTLCYQVHDQSDYQQHIVCNIPCEVLVGYAPDNPATSDLAYSLLRSQAATLQTLTLHDLSDDQSYAVEDVVFLPDSVQFTLTDHQKRRVIRYDLVNCQLALD